MSYINGSVSVCVDHELFAVRAQSKNLFVGGGLLRRIMIEWRKGVVQAGGCGGGGFKRTSSAHPRMQPPVTDAPEFIRGWHGWGSIDGSQIHANSI